MLPKDKWEESRHEAKDLAQDYLDKEKTRSSCIKYFESHFKYLHQLLIDGITEFMMN